MTDQLHMTVKRCLTRYRFFDSSGPLVVAVSTGVDSMVLLAVLEDLVPNKRIVVVHVNHHLRAQSQTEERYIRNYCDQHGLRLFVDEWEDHPDHGVEDAARQARYRFFEQVVDKVHAGYLLTAHHKNDLAETMLMKLVRTGDVRSAIGIREARPFGPNTSLLRPFLGISKHDLIVYAQDHGIKWFEDQTNHEDDTQRNRFRHHYLPALHRENPQVIDHLLKFHHQLAELLDLQDEVTRQNLQQIKCDDQVLLKEYQRLPKFQRQLVLNRWLNEDGLFAFNDDRISQFDHWLCNGEEPTGHMQIRTHWMLKKDYDTFYLENVNKNHDSWSKLSDFMLKFDHWNDSVDGGQFGVFTHSTNELVATLWLTPDQLPLKVRAVQPTDAIRLKSGHYQRIRRILIDDKVPKEQRARQQVVVDAHGEVLWLVRHKTAWLSRRHLSKDAVTIGYCCQKANTGE